MVKGWSIVFLGQKLIDFLDAKMTSQNIIVVTANQPCSNSLKY